MSIVYSYEDLSVWKKSMNLAEKIYGLTKFMPKEEVYGLTAQMRRAAVSIPSNIAEGQQRASTKEFLRFLSIARGSNAELQTQLVLACRLGYFQSEQIRETMNLTKEVSKMINALMISLNKRPYI